MGFLARQKRGDFFFILFSSKIGMYIQQLLISVGDLIISGLIDYLIAFPPIENFSLNILRHITIAGVGL
jgi:hypothetical protein